ncbi:MAG: NADH-quinone oxidoreductase subunit C [Longimicrobiales bacterium]
MAKGDLNDALRDLDSGPQASPAAASAPAGEPAEAQSHASVAALRERFGDAVLHHTVVAGDEHVVYIAAERAREILGWLRDTPDHDYRFLSDVTAVDFGGGRPLEVVYQLWSLSQKRQLRVKATLPLSALEIDSAVPLWAAANWLEREVYDLFGIHFRGHPDLRRIMMPENYAEGHPLRKDFPLRGRFSRAEQTRRALEMEVDDFYIPSELAVADERFGARQAAVQEAPAGAPEPSAPRGRRGPKDADDWSLGTEGSAAGGAASPEGAAE